MQYVYLPYHAIMGALSLLVTAGHLAFFRQGSVTLTASFDKTESTNRNFEIDKCVKKIE